KLVWLLEHEYSKAGLSFGGLKNTNAAVARVLTRAAERVECEALAAVVHIEQYGSANYDAGDWGWDGEDEDGWEMGEVVDSREWLDSWARADGQRPPLGEVELLPGELLPRGALDDATPDEQRGQASGNEGVSVERTYRRAALVLWPRSKALEIVARSDIAGAVAWVADEHDRLPDTGSGRVRELLSRLIDIWPTRPYDEDAQARALMLRLLHSTGDENPAARYLMKVVLKRYDGSENEPLALVVDMLGPSAARRFLTELAPAHLRRRPTVTLALVRCLDETRDESSRGAWNRVLQAAVRAILRTLPAALPPGPRRDSFEPMIQAPERFGVEAVDDLFTLAWRRGSTAEVTAAAEAVAGRPEVVTPDRTLPAVLAKLHGEEGAAGSGAFALLWRHAANFLLARSATPPEEPRDWTIDADTGCRCEHCRRLRDFCKDPAARIARFPLRKALRAHLHQTIDGRGLDIEHVTERRATPLPLVGTKTPPSPRRRLAEYADDISCMRDLIRSAPSGEQAAPCAPDLARLHEAVAAAAR
ncbi:MAG: hypothetical protein OXG35_26165, partial [Acidobacteria bacterium]|nr:hypothetical protein [Acidobacteriota bacterium]